MTTFLKLYKGTPEQKGTMQLEKATPIFRFSSHPLRFFKTETANFTTRLRAEIPKV